MKPFQDGLFCDEIEAKLGEGGRAVYEFEKLPWVGVGLLT